VPNLANYLYRTSANTIDGGGSLAVIGSTGVIGAASLGHKLMVQGAGAAGDSAVMAFHRPGSWAAGFGIDTDNQWKVGGWSYGNVSYALLHEGNSFSLATANMLTTPLAVISARAVSGGYANAGAYSGGLDFRTAQSYGVNPGSSISAIYCANGQVFRIVVNGSGAITMPSNTKWTTGSPVWGTTATVVSCFSPDGGGTLYATTMPFTT
jgi:hypothetical protein